MNVELGKTAQAAGKAGNPEGDVSSMESRYVVCWAQARKGSAPAL